MVDEPFFVKPYSHFGFAASSPLPKNCLVGLLKMSVANSVGLLEII